MSALPRYDEALQHGDPAEDADYAAAVATTVRQLADAITTALNAVGQAQAALTALVGPQLYAIEYAEGSGGDIDHHLSDASRSLRTVRALSQIATAYTLGEQPA